MTKVSEAHTFEQYEEWVSRMDLGVEELGLAGNDKEWRSFIEDKLTEHLGGKPTDRQLGSMVSLGKEISKDVGYSFSTVVIRGKEQNIFRDVVTGRFISAGDARGYYNDFMAFRAKKY